MRVIFIHGMKNEGQNPDELKTKWHDALREGWDKAGAAVPVNYEVVLPYYGDTLHKLTDGAGREGPGVARRGPEDVGPNVGDFEQEYYKLLKEKLGIPTEEIVQELPATVVERGPANWEWVQAIARAVQKRSPKISDFALKAVPQVDGYLNRRTVQQAVDAIVRPTLAQGKTIVVAHSLGTIVAYRLLKELSGQLDMPLFFTLGSPLGIDLVVRRVAPIMTPKTVRTWINGADERDYVALVSKLEKPNYGIPITNIADIRNGGDDPHSITEYLKQKSISKAIADAMR